MIYSGNTVGLILFSSFIALNRAGITNPLRLIMGKQLRKVADSGCHTKEIDLIQYHSPQFKSNKWRKMKSSDGEGSCEVEVINNLDEPVLFCWINEKGELKHYRPIMDRSIKDKSVTNIHLEYTQVGHSFVCIKQMSCLPHSLREIPKDAFVFCCSLTTKDKKTVLVLEKQNAPTKRNLIAYLRGTQPEHNGIDVVSHLADATSKANLIDTTGKIYHERVIHGFKVKYEPDVFDVTPNLEEILSLDLSKVVELFPPAACRKLQETTTFWVNTSITFGTVSAPVVATMCTFHPNGGADWLENNGLTVEKEGGVEICSAAEYLRSRQYWGDGGIIVHELNHAYHNKCCPDGFDCEEIRQAYNVAMAKKLYDNCKVHGPQGAAGTAKAYACANCMEFWAELSVAYHWTQDTETEYNKWFPFNRAQLKEHDPESFAVIDKYWHIHDN